MSYSALSRWRISGGLLALAGALAAAVVGFQLVYGLRLLSAADAYWTNPPGDMGQMLAGELAGLRAPWSLPILTPDTLTAPDRVSLVYTDSIPWLTALLKALHLGRTVGLLGTFLLLAWLAQPAAMYVLLHAAGVRRVSTLFAGSILALLVPAWLARQLGHIALSGQAIQILALAIGVQGIRSGLTGRLAAGIVGLGVLAVGVHAYHVPPVTLMLAAALASDVFQQRPGAGRRAAVAGGSYLLAVIAAAWAAGYFVGRGGSGGVAALGVYEMNIMAPFLPQGSALAGQKWTGNWFTHSFDPTGSQFYEGYNYLGAGVLLLLLASALMLWRERRQYSESITERGEASSAAPVAEIAARTWARRWGPLATALILLTFYALGTKPYLGSINLLTVPLPDRPWMEPLTLFRCHGRFFWTAGYALLAGALVVVDRASSVKWRAALLVLAVLLQAADMSQMLSGLRGRFSSPEPLRVPSALLGPAFRARDIRAYPGFFCTTDYWNQLVIRQLSLIAQRQGASSNTAETARQPVGACSAQPPADLRVDAPPGDRRVTVLMSPNGAPSAVTTLFARRTDCFSYRAFWMCGRDLASIPELTPVAGSQLLSAAHQDAEINVGRPPAVPALLSGWSTPEGTGVWSDGARAVLRLTPPATGGSPMIVTLDALGYQPPARVAQHVHVSVNGRPLAEWRLEAGGYHGVSVAVPAELLHPGRPVDLVLDLPDAVSPNVVLPASGDPRRLGIGVRQITMAH